MAIAALVLTLAGFALGWVLAGAGGWLLASREEPREVVPEDPPRPQDPSIPDEDVTGSDIPGLDRYPGSVRIEYIREEQGDLIWTEVEYLTSADLSQVREFYRHTFRAEDWAVNDIGFAQSAWVFFIVKGEREVFVELKPRGNIVEIDIEQTEPQEEEPEESRNRNNGDERRNEEDEANERDDSPGAQGGQAPDPATQQPAPQPAAPAAPAATPAPAAPVTPAPVYDDDYGDYDDDYGEYDD